MSGERPIDKAVRRHISAGSGLDINHVLSGNPPSRPHDTYATLLLVTDRPLSRAVYRQQDDGSTVVASRREAIYSLQFYREDAIDRAEQFAGWAESETGLERATMSGHDDGLGIEVETPIEFDRDDEPVGDKLEPRARTRLRVMWDHVRREDSGYVTDVRGSLDPDADVFDIEGAVSDG